MTGGVAAVVMTAALVADATSGRLTSGARDAVFESVSIDSRTVSPGALFVALKGDRFDGHDYVAQACERGAAGCMVSSPVAAPASAVVVEVGDTIEALQSLAREIRRRSGATVIAITGSAGKTSTKEITADLLATRYRVFRNRGNLNNHIGLPLSLTELARGPEMAVVELGMNHPGEIRQLVRVAEPDTRLWTNVGDAHIGYFGSREAVARAKAEILESASGKSILVANADDPLVMAHAGAFAGRVVTFGTTDAAQVRAIDIQDKGFEGLQAKVLTHAGELQLSLSLPGRPHLMNVLAGVSVAMEYGIEPDAIVRTVAAARAVARRGALTTLPNGARVVDDSYNASPAAVQSMLKALAATPGAARRIAVLGEMLELGDEAPRLHEACGQAAQAAGVDLLAAVGGAPADELLRGAIAAGLPADKTLRFSDSVSAASRIAALIQRGDLILVKGSRGTRTDLIVDAIVQAGRQG